MSRLFGSLEQANDTYGTFKVGTHDDLVTALGPAVLLDEPLRPRLPVTLALGITKGWGY